VGTVEERGGGKRKTERERERERESERERRGRVETWWKCEIFSSRIRCSASLRFLLIEFRLSDRFDNNDNDERGK